MNRFLMILFSWAILCSTSGLSCSGEKEDEPAEPVNPMDNTKRTVLIYAVASNNLANYLKEDKNEMIQAAPDIQGLGTDVRVLLYSVASQNATEATLSELSKDDYGNWNFKDILSYDRDTFSTDPERMRQVYADLKKEAPALKYGLVFWSHGTGWVPNFTDHQIPTSLGESQMQKSYGVDKYQGVTDYCDIDELADALPEGMFDYVWFDCCYMMGVETVYQLRNKCDYIGGYPTEDWSPGMNYDETLPLLALASSDLLAAGQAFFDYYNNQNMAVTVTVIKTDGLERLAQVASDIYAYGSRPKSTSGMQNYSRLKTAMYDFGQFTKKYLDDADPQSKILSEAFDKSLKDITVFGGCSSKDFNNKLNAFDPEIYSGLSCHFPGSTTAASETYYESLDWYQKTHP